MVERIEVAVEDLLLDLENPRIGTVQTQAEALEAIVELNAQHFRGMISSISEHGLDPGDSFYVIADDADPGAFIVVDGNRRLSSLKVLQNAALLNGTGLADGVKKSINTLVESAAAKGPDAVPCVVFDDRGSADSWIERRHGAGLEGEGRIAWGALEKQRFQHDRSLLDVIDFVERNSTYSDDDWAAVKKSVQAKPSVLARFLESKAGRDWFGFAIEEIDGVKHPTFTVDPKSALSFLTKLMEDIRDKVVDTRTYNKSGEIEGYFDRHADPKAKRAAKAQKFDVARINDAEVRPRKDAKPAATKKSPAKTTKPKAARLTLAPLRHAFKQPETEKGRQLVRECSRIRLDQPLASAFLLRAFLQHTVDAYMETHKLPFHEKDAQGNTKQLDLKVRFERVYAHLVSSKTAKGGDLHGVKSTLTARTDPVSVQSLNDYHHDKYRIPGADVLRNAWDSAEPLFVAVYGAA